MVLATHAHLWFLFPSKTCSCYYYHCNQSTCDQCPKKTPATVLVVSVLEVGSAVDVGMGTVNMWRLSLTVWGLGLLTQNVDVGHIPGVYCVCMCMNGWVCYNCAYLGVCSCALL